MDFLDFIFPRNSKEFKVFSQEQQRHLGSLTKSTTKYEDVSYSPLSRGLAMQDFHFLWGNTVGYLACSPLWSEGLFSAVTKLANRSHQWKGQKWWLDGSGGLQTLAYLLRGAGIGWLPVVYPHMIALHMIPPVVTCSPSHPIHDLSQLTSAPLPNDQDPQGVGNSDLFSPQSIILFLTLPDSPQAFCFHSNYMFYRSSRLKFASWLCLSLLAIRIPILMEVMWISLIKGRIKNKKAQERKAQVIINLHKAQEKRNERPDIKILTVVLLIVFVSILQIYYHSESERKWYMLSVKITVLFFVTVRKSVERQTTGHCNGLGSSQVSKGKTLLIGLFELSIK